MNKIALNKIAKSVIHKAKNTHRCSDCGQSIKPGGEYRYIFGAEERKAYGLKLCRKCDPDKKDYKSKLCDICNFEDFCHKLQLPYCDGKDYVEG